MAAPRNLLCNLSHLPSKVGADFSVFSFMNEINQIEEHFIFLKVSNCTVCMPSRDEKVKFFYIH